MSAETKNEIAVSLNAHKTAFAVLDFFFLPLSFDSSFVDKSLSVCPSSMMLINVGGNN